MATLLNRTWKAAVTAALQRYAARHQTVQIERAAFVAEELVTMVAQTASSGRTPAQTVSRVLQELRDEGQLFFSATGTYTMVGKPIDAAAEDLPDDVLDHAVSTETLLLIDVETADARRYARLRKGMRALRRAALRNYEHRCALCDIDDERLLVTSHVTRWADDVGARGRLSNVICLCGAHDMFFEQGYFALTNAYDVIWRQPIASSAIRVWARECTTPFRQPRQSPPSAEYLLAHRTRCALSP